jgi:flavin-dependent dehydrogenase
LFYIKAGNQTFQSRIACGAYGKQSLQAGKAVVGNNKAKINYIGVKYHIHSHLPENRIELHNFRDGYCGVSKVDGNKYCLCYLTDSRNLRNNQNNIKKMEQEVLMKNPFLKKYFTESDFLFERPVTVSQLTFNKKQAVQNHVFMLGDSAGNIAPLCGNGMSMAMHASFILFQWLEKFLANGISRESVESGYSKQWNDLFSARIVSGKYIQYLFGGDALTNLSIATLKKFPSLADKLISITHGNKF